MICTPTTQEFSSYVEETSLGKNLLNTMQRKREGRLHKNRVHISIVSVLGHFVKILY